MIDHLFAWLFTARQFSYMAIFGAFMWGWWSRNATECITKKYKHHKLKKKVQHRLHGAWFNDIYPKE